MKHLNTSWLSESSAPKDPRYIILNYDGNVKFSFYLNVKVAKLLSLKNMAAKYHSIWLTVPSWSIHLWTVDCYQLPQTQINLFL